MSNTNSAAKGAAGCLVLIVVLAIRGAVLVGAVWLVVWALRATGVIA
jgi:hypothetical protein